MTARESLLAYLTTLMAAVPGVKVYRSREAALARNESPAVVLQPDEEQVTAQVRGMDLVVREFTVSITVIARASGTEPVADKVADPLLQALHAAIMVDTTLGGRCAIITEHSTTWDFEVADGTAVAAEARYAIRYQTRASDLTTPL